MQGAELAYGGAPLVPPKNCEAMRHLVKIELSRRCFVDDVEVERLTHKEALLLEIVLKRRSLVSTRAVMEALYGSEVDWPAAKTLNVFVHHIRAKLGAHAAAIGTVWGQGFEAGPGYILDVPTAKTSIEIPALLANEIADVAFEADLDLNTLATELLRGALPVYRKQLWAA